MLQKNLNNDKPSSWLTWTRANAAVVLIISTFIRISFRKFTAFPLIMCKMVQASTRKEQQQRWERKPLSYRMEWHLQWIFALRQRWTAGTANRKMQTKALECSSALFPLSCILEPLNASIHGKKLGDICFIFVVSSPGHPKLPHPPNRQKKHQNFERKLKFGPIASYFSKI